MAAIPIFAETEQTGRQQHVSGAYQPSFKQINNPGATLDASDANVINLTGTGSADVNLITVADPTIDQQIALINLTSNVLTFATTGVQSGNNRAIATAFRLPVKAAVILYFEPTNDIWHGASVAQVPALLLGAPYTDFNNAAWETLDPGRYRLAGLGSSFVNPPTTLVPGADYDFFVDHVVTTEIYGDQVVVTAVGDQDTANREFIRSGTSFAAALTTGWDQKAYVGDVIPSTLVSYDNADSSLVSILVKTALDELDAKIEAVTEAYGGSWGIEDADLPESVPLNLVWTEFVPTNTPTYGNAQNVIAGANNGRLKIDYGGASVGVLNLSLKVLLSIRFPAADQTLEVGMMINGSVYAPSLLTIQATSTGGFLTTGITLPVTFAVDTISSVNDGDEISFALRRIGAAFTCEIASCLLTVRGAEPGKIGGAGSTDRRETRIEGAAQTDRDAQNWMGSLLSYNDDGAGNEQEFTIDYPPEGIATFAATSVWDANTSPAVVLTLTGDTTLNLLAPPTADGRQYVLVVVQDATGGHELTLGASFADSAQVLPIRTGGTSTSVIAFYSTNSLLHRSRTDAVNSPYIVEDLTDTERGRLHWDTGATAIELRGVSTDLQVITEGGGDLSVDSVDNLLIRAGQALDLFSGYIDGVSVMRLNPNTDHRVEISTEFQVDPDNEQVIYQPTGGHHTNLIVRSSNNGNPAFNARMQVERFNGAAGIVVEALDGANNITYKGNGVINNDTDAQYVELNQYRFLRDDAGDTFLMPTADIPGGGYFKTDGAAGVTLEALAGGSNPDVDDLTTLTGTEFYTTRVQSGGAGLEYRSPLQALQDQGGEIKNLTEHTSLAAGDWALVQDDLDNVVKVDVARLASAAPIGAGEWTYAGVGTGVAVAAQTFRVDSANLTSTTSMRIHELERGGRNTGPLLDSVTPGDQLYFYSNQTPTQFATYEVTEAFTQPSATEYLFNNLLHVDGPSATWAGNYQGFIIWSGPGDPVNPPNPRIGTFSSSAGTVAVDLADIEVAYVTCNEAAVTVTFSNGVNGKGYNVLFIDTAGNLVLTAGANTAFGSDITGYQTHTGTGKHWYGVRYYQPDNEYQIVAFALGY